MKEFRHILALFILLGAIVGFAVILSSADRRLVDRTCQEYAERHGITYLGREMRTRPVLWIFRTRIRYYCEFEVQEPGARKQEVSLPYWRTISLPGWGLLSLRYVGIIILAAGLVWLVRKIGGLDDG